MLGVLVIGNILNMAKLVVQGYQGQPTSLFTPSAPALPATPDEQ